jgi:hypothetical protein
VGSPAGLVGMPLQYSGWDHQGGLGYPDALGCGLGECTTPGLQDGSVARRLGDLVAPGLKFGVGVIWPGTGAGLVEWRGAGAGWLPRWPAACVTGGLLTLPGRSGSELGGAGAATVPCASC